MATLVVGLTGGIGSGKSTVAEVFNTLGVPTFNADLNARAITNAMPSVVSKIKEAFGDAIYQHNLLDRAAMAKLVFNNPDALAKLNAIVHPATRQAFLDWKAQQNAPYILYEAAILFEAGADSVTDRTILVYAPQAERINRVVARDNVSPQDVAQRIANQWADERKAALATYIINNSGNTPLLPQVLTLHQIFSKVE